MVLVTLGVLDAVPDPLPVVNTQDSESYLRWIVGAERLIGQSASIYNGFMAFRLSAAMMRSKTMAMAYITTQLKRLGSSGARRRGLWLSGGLMAILDDGGEVGVRKIWLMAETSSLAFLSGTASSVELGRLLISRRPQSAPNRKVSKEMNLH